MSNALKQLPDSPNYRRMFVPRDLHWGAPETVALIEALGAHFAPRGYVPEIGNITGRDGRNRYSRTHHGGPVDLAYPFADGASGVRDPLGTTSSPYRLPATASREAVAAIDFARLHELLAWLVATPPVTHVLIGQAVMPALRAHQRAKGLEMPRAARDGRAVTVKTHPAHDDHLHVAAPDPTALAFAGGGLEAADAPTDQAEVAVGDSTVSLDRWAGPRADLALLNLHENEATSVRAARSLHAELGATLFRLHQRGERDLRFEADGRRYGVDPNRVFSRVGIERSIKKLTGKAPPAAAVDAVEAFAKELLRLVDVRPGATVVGLHNNTNRGPLTLSCFDPEGGSCAADAEDVHPSTLHRDPDDFFFVTRREDFDALAALNESVVLQRQTIEDAHDDGSLSVYCARHGVRYVNVESEHGHVDEQRRMLQTLRAIL